MRSQLRGSDISIPRHHHAFPWGWSSTFCRSEHCGTPLVLQQRVASLTTRKIGFFRNPFFQFCVHTPSTGREVVRGPSFVRCHPTTFLRRKSSGRFLLISGSWKGNIRNRTLSVCGRIAVQNTIILVIPGNSNLPLGDSQLKVFMEPRGTSRPMHLGF